MLETPSHRLPLTVRRKAQQRALRNPEVAKLYKKRDDYLHVKRIIPCTPELACFALAIIVGSLLFVAFALSDQLFKRK